MVESILSTADGTIIRSGISGGLLSADDGAITIDNISKGGYTPGAVGDKPLYATIGTPNVPIYSTTNVPIYETIMIETPGSDLSDYWVAGEAIITISWDQTSRRDLDCCCYWADNSDHKVGWSWGNGSLADDNYKLLWTGDNTGLGPEYIHIYTTAARRSTKESSPYQYKVHLNFYGSASGTPTATVYVTFRGLTLSKTIAPATNSGQKATESDPYVTITFANDGTPISIA